MKTIRLAIAALMLCFISLSAHASLIGANVNMSAYFPNSTSLFLDPGNATVSDAVEYVAGSYSPSYNDSWEIDIGANQLVITATLSTGFPFVAAAFNGWILDVISGPNIVSASIDASSGFSPFAISVVGGDLQLNYAGVQGPQRASSVINFRTETTSLPEPGTLSLFAIGLMGITWIRRRNIA